MHRIRSTFARFRLLNSVIALAVLLSALAVTPVSAEKVCDDICSGWNVKDGCVTCNHCCVEDGKTTCQPKSDKDCGTGGPGLAE